MVGAIAHNVLSFPDELLLSVMTFFEPSELCKLALVNRRFRQLSNDSSLWLPQIQRIKLITDMTLGEIGLKPKQAYLQHVCIHRNLEQGRYQTTTLQHTNLGTSVAAFGDKVVSGSCDFTVRVWDLENSEKTIVMKGHEKSVRAVATLGNKVVSGSYDSTVRVWNLENSENPMVLQHEDWVNAVATLGNKVVSASIDRTVRVWNLEDPEKTVVLQGHQGWVNAVATLGNKVVSGSGDFTVRVWDLEDPENPVVLQGHKASVNAVATFGDKIVSGSGDSTVRVWNVEARTYVVINVNSEVFSLAVKGSRIFVGLFAGSIVIYDFLK